jgi:hypothetical protein
MLTRIGVRLACALITASGAAAAQGVRDCANGNVSYPDSLGDLSKRLRALQWRDAYGDFAKRIAADGAPAALAILRSRTRDLLAASGDTNSAHAHALLARQNEIAQELSPDLSRGKVWIDTAHSYSDFLPDPFPDIPNTVEFVRDSSGRRLRLTVDLTKPSVVALCAAANATHSFLMFVDGDAFDAVAAEYAEAAHRWDEFIANGYSMTFVERWAQSCRFPALIGVFVATTSYVSGRCGKSRALGPPRFQTVFAHPVVAFINTADSAENFTEGGAVEWWGIVHHMYKPGEMVSYGISAATTHPRKGQREWGALLHTPLGMAGWFGALKGPRRQFILSADLQGWIPRIRDAARSMERSGLAHRLTQVAESIRR